MKIDKKLIKELVDHLSEFNLTELEYQEGQTKIKVSRASKLLLKEVLSSENNEVFWDNDIILIDALNIISNSTNQI